MRYIVGEVFDMEMVGEMMDNVQSVSIISQWTWSEG